MSEMTLEARIQRLEDIEELKQLKIRYAAYCDDDYNADGLVPLFTESAIWDGGPMGRFEGHDALRTFFSSADQTVPFAIHHVTNPLIEVEGDRATGRWYLWQPCTFGGSDGGTGDGLWMAAQYDDIYRREDGVCRFEHVVINLRMLSPYEAGWAKMPMIEVPV